MLDIILSTRIILKDMLFLDQPVKVSVSLYGELKVRIEYDRTTLELAPNSDICRVLSILNLPLEEVVIALVNGKAKSLDYTLENDDHVDIFPPLKGG